jgi:hypothetical protein
LGELEMMDIKTEKGQKTLEDEHRAAHLFEHHHPTHKYVMTPKDLPVELDAVIVRDGYLQAVVETKCRYDMTLDELRYARDFKWLISTSKIVAGEKASALLGVRFFGFLYLVQDGVLLYRSLTDHRGQLLDGIYFEERETQATVNGGRKISSVALIDMKNANILR